jgi:hypothetical protein
MEREKQLIESVLNDKERYEWDDDRQAHEIYDDENALCVEIVQEVAELVVTAEEMREHIDQGMRNAASYVPKV